MIQQFCQKKNTITFAEITNNPAFIFEFRLEFNQKISMDFNLR